MSSPRAPRCASLPLDGGLSDLRPETSPRWASVFCKMGVIKDLQGFPGGLVVKISVLQVLGAWVRSLVRELGSHMLCGAAKR